MKKNSNIQCNEFPMCWKRNTLWWQNPSYKTHLYVVFKPCTIPHGCHTNRSPYLCALLGELSLPFEVGKWVPDNTRTNSHSSMRRVAPIHLHWWCDQQLSISQVIRSHPVDSFNGTLVQVCTVLVFFIFRNPAIDQTFSTLEKYLWMQQNQTS